MYLREDIKNTKEDESNVSASRFFLKDSEYKIKFIQIDPLEVRTNVPSFPVAEGIVHVREKAAVRAVSLGLRVQVNCRDVVQAEAVLVVWTIFQYIQRILFRQIHACHQTAVVLSTL